MKKVIELTPAEIQSGLTRVKWAEALIRQLPDDHDGRNSWLLNYSAAYEFDQDPWNGEGLPPVGVVVEVLWSSISKSYVTGFILAHDEGRAVFRFTSGERKGEYQADKSHFSSEPLLPNFRPIRTAEQIAAEEREGAIRKMEQTSGSHVGSAITRVICERLYDAGARMPGEGSKA